VTHAVVVALALLGIAGQVLALVLAVIGIAALVGVRGPLAALRRGVWGYELWLAFVVSATATAGSLFFSQVAHFVPCELCWFQRICMYPVALLTLLAALANDYRVARYLLPLPVIGAGFSVYHLLVENGIVHQTQGASASPAFRTPGRTGTGDRHIRRA
jgi:disulfide bond formation protein DsbB